MRLLSLIWDELSARKTLKRSNNLILTIVQHNNQLHLHTWIIFRPIGTRGILCVLNVSEELLTTECWLWAFTPPASKTWPRHSSRTLQLRLCKLQCRQSSFCSHQQSSWLLRDGRKRTGLMSPCSICKFYSLFLTILLGGKSIKSETELHSLCETSRRRSGILSICCPLHKIISLKLICPWR